MKIPAALVLSATLGLSAPAFAQQCGGDFGAWKNQVTQEAQQAGIGQRGMAALQGARIDQKVLARDRAQGVFNQTFTEFSGRMINSYRLKNGAGNIKKYGSVFAKAEADYGVPAAVITAFWALETDFGAVQGDFNTLGALVTLAHDCRRPNLFRPQIFAALELYRRGGFDPARTTGAWAGEIGQVQMLPRDILENGVDGDGDGRVDLKSSAPDALMSGANMLRALGWRAGEPWLQEVRLPAGLDWSLTGPAQTRTVAEWAAMGVSGRNEPLANGSLPAAILLPQGRHGPAFIAYPNFGVYFDWNQSFVYVLTAAYFATRLEGAPVYDAGNPDPGLSGEDMKRLQTRLMALGHDVGGIDGILGAKTRDAVQAEQARLGLPADAWPTRELLNRL